MLKEFGIRPHELLEFSEVKIGDGILLLELQNTKPSKRAHASRRVAEEEYDQRTAAPEVCKSVPVGEVTDLIQLLLPSALADGFGPSNS